MTTQKQLEANRRNARKSSGPKTQPGKSLSKLNALKHGLRAEQVLVPGEDEREFADLRQGLLEDLRPEGALEIELFHGLVVDFWRLRRLRMVEVGVFVHRTGPRDTFNSSFPQVADGDSGLPGGLGRAFVRDGSGTNAFSKLSRYEASLTRSIHRAINKLLELQAQRRGQQMANDENEGNGGERLPLPANQT